MTTDQDDVADHEHSIAQSVLRNLQEYDDSTVDNTYDDELVECCRDSDDMFDDSR